MKPVHVPLKGGLGNQMFQIAAAYAYAKREGGQLLLLKMDRCGSRPVYWDTFFTAFASELVESVLPMPVWQEPMATKYMPLPALTAEGLCLDGYLQSSKYFAEIKDEIREKFRAPRSVEAGVEEKYAYLLSQVERVVVMHARRTDYLLHQEVHAPVGVKYYQRMVDEVLATVERPLFLLVSDDPSFWGCMEPHIPEVFQGEFHILRDATDVETMILLQRFRHFVMSNSTFIWWAVWLADAQHVWVPKRWFGPRGPAEWGDVYEDFWKQVDF